MTGGSKPIHPYSVIVTVILLAVVVVGLGNRYERLDNSGRINHEAQMPVLIDSSWLMGEFRSCTMYSDGLRLFDCASSYESKPHVMPFLFHGRIDRKDRESFEWRCQRHSESLECWAVN